MTTKKKVIYIAGKMTGEPDMGRAKFNKMEKKIKASGHIPLNPARLPQGMPRERYMPICLAMIDKCDAIMMLDNWQQSPGAILEREYARYQGKSILYQKGCVFRDDHRKYAPEMGT